MPTVSLVVPIYKVNKYIEKCVTSLFEQTQKDMEFIFVDDCTPDNSIEILENVLNKYPDRKEQTVILRNEKNMGVSISRLKGLYVASGEYVSFVDPDDWVENNMYELLYKEGEEKDFDIVICDYYNEFQEYVAITTFKESTAQECLANLFRKGYFPYTLWCQIFKRELFEKESVNINNIQSTNHGEDLWLNICAHLHAQSIGFVHVSLYHYNRMNENSMVKTFSRQKDKWLAQKQNVEMISNLLLAYDCDKMKRAVNWLRFLVKMEYKKTFDDPKEWFYTFNESHKYILEYEHLGDRKNLIKTWFIMRFYTFFRLYQILGGR